MQWSPQQDAALKAVHEWFRAGDSQIFRVFGYAGTGKTTLAQHFAEGIDGSVLFGAYTGKAAHVLQQKGCLGASTIHSLIYNPKDKSRLRLLELEGDLTERRVLCEGLERDPEDDTEYRDLARQVEAERRNLAQPSFSLNFDSLVPGADLVVIDECSMVDGKMGEDLLSFGTKVLVLGDPAQLPPVGGGGFFTEHTPDVMLTEIHRQAADNPIIALATRVREGERLPLGQYGSSRVIMKHDLDPALPREVDQLLAGRNVTRRNINARMRELALIAEPMPVPEDKVVCLRNNHDLGLLNGSLWRVEDVGEIGPDRVYMSVVSLDSPGTYPITVEAHTTPFRGENIDMPWWERKEAEEFDYGYCLTVHKAQGSQWNNVLMFDESGCFRKDARRWLYTGITRAAERVTIVQGM